jgi:hypothetical protein
VDTATVGPYYDTVRAGEYEIRGMALTYSGGAHAANIITNVNGSLTGNQGGAVPTAGGQNFTMAYQSNVVVGAAQRIKMMVQVSVAGNGWQHRAMRVTPIRIS